MSFLADEAVRVKAEHPTLNVIARSTLLMLFRKVARREPLTKEERKALRKMGVQLSLSRGEILAAKEAP